MDGTENNSEQQPRYDEAGNEVEKKVGPWKRVETHVEVPEKEEKKIEPPPPTTNSSGAYVPPSLRNAQQQPVHQPRNRGKAAPDIHNEEYFPTLAGSKSDKRLVIVILS